MQNTKLRILGGIPLKGQINISPAKNAFLPLLAASLVTKDIITIPISGLMDINYKLELLEHIGYKVIHGNDNILIVPSNDINNNLPDNIVGLIRSSILFLGPLLALTGKVSLHFPGGDDLSRSFDFHIDCLKKMGAEIIIKDNHINGHMPNNEKLRGIEYTFSKPSVGATQHMILTAILTEKGTKTILNNCAQEPECLFLIEVLIEKFKAKIKKIGTQIIIEGNGERLFTNIEHDIEIIPDRIESLTYLSLSMITNGEITIKAPKLLHYGGQDLNLLVEAGGTLLIEGPYITMKKSIDTKINSIKYFESGEFPEISTDFAPIMCTLLGVADGTSIFTEKVHKNRFKYINELNKFGGVLTPHNCKDNTIIIHGSEYIPSSEGVCTDIRGGMSLVMAALRSKGISVINNCHHIFRGYDYIIEKITSLGGKIEII